MINEWRRRTRAGMDDRVRPAAGRRRGWSGRLGGAVTCPTCFGIHLEAHAHAKPWAWHPTDLPYLLVEDWHRHGCRMRKGFRRGCGPERIPGRAALTCPTCSVGSFGHREFLRCWLLALGRRGLVFSFQRAGRGAFSNQLSVVSQTRERTQGVLRNGRVERSGGELRLRLMLGLCDAGERSRWRQVDALLRRCDLAGL